MTPDGIVRCPFCASVHVAMGQRKLRAQNLIKFYVHCDVCWARGPACFGRSEAHTAWNERTYGLDHNTAPEWTEEERTGGPQVAEWAERQKAAP